MKKSKLLSVFLLLLSVSSCSNAKPIKSECIFKIEVLWKDASTSEKNSILGEVMHPMSIRSHSSFQVVHAGGSYVENRYIFYQLTDLCSNKLEISESFTEVISIKYKDKAEFKVVRGVYEPGINTIIRNGKFWSD